MVTAIKLIQIKLQKTDPSVLQIERDREEERAEAQRCNPYNYTENLK